MIWGRVVSVVRQAAAAIASQVTSDRNRHADTSGPALHTSPQSKPSGAVLERRAMRVCNRQPDQINRYLAVHQILDRGN